VLRLVQELAAALVRLERCDTAEALEPIVADILDLIERTLPTDVRNAIGRAFTTFIAEVLHKRGVEIEAAQIDDLRGFKKMLEAQVDKWAIDWKKKGFDEGIGEGMGRMLRLLFARRLARELTEAEMAVFEERVRTLGPETVGETLLELDGDGLRAWLAGEGGE